MPGAASQRQGATQLGSPALQSNMQTPIDLPGWSGRHTPRNRITPEFGIIGDLNNSPRKHETLTAEACVQHQHAPLKSTIHRNGVIKYCTGQLIGGGYSQEPPVRACHHPGAGAAIRGRARQQGRSGRHVRGRS